MQILNHVQIQQKIKRLAIQILENNFDVDEIILAGINNKGMKFAQLMLDELNSRSDVTCHLCQIRLNPADPLADEVSLDINPASLKDKNIIVFDDVANTGRTLFYAMIPFLTTLPQKIEIAVLVDRKHKAFPIYADYVGVSLATTAKENIEVQIDPAKEFSARFLAT